MKKCVSIILTLILVVTSNMPFSSGVSYEMAEELTRPDGLYAVDYFSELSENISKAEIIVLGNYDFSEDVVYTDEFDKNEATSDKHLHIDENRIKNNIQKYSISKKKDNNEMKMIFIAHDAIEDQYEDDNAEILRTALENGYIIFFECDDAKTINRINKDVFEEYDNLFANEDANSEDEEVNDGKKSFFFISKSKDDFIYYSIIDTYYNGNKELFDRSILEHAWSNRNNINYVEDMANYEAALRNEAVESSSIMSVSAAGIKDYEIFGVTFHGRWVPSQYIFKRGVEWESNLYENLSHRMIAQSRILMSDQVTDDKRIWANVASIDITPNNTSETLRPYYSVNAWYWSQVKTSQAEVKSYAPANAPKNTTYNYGLNIGASGGISGSGANASVSVGASFSITTTTSNIEYYTNKYYDGEYNGTTFQMAFDGNNNYTRNNSSHTTVTFFETSGTRNSITISNKLRYQIQLQGVLTVTDRTSYEYFHTVTYNPLWSTKNLK